ncbi:MAG: hypothetical protein J6X91_08435 [Bacteroidales bacterium]|nr:hypothetical protein [Bacteroidales bacterium]
MKQFFLLFASLAILASCGNQNQNKNTNTETPEVTEAAPAAQEQEAEVKLPEITEPVAYQAWMEIAKSHGLEGKYICPENSTVGYTAEAENDEEAEGYMIDDQVSCYPYKDGGFFTVHSHVEAAEGQGGEFEYTFYNFKDGVLTKIDNPLPVPEFADLLSDSKDAPLQEDMVARLENLFKSRPGDFVAYEFYPEEYKLKAYLHPLSWGRDVEPDETGHYNWLEQFYEMRARPDKNTYKWNGESFIKAE